MSSKMTIGHGGFDQDNGIGTSSPGDNTHGLSEEAAVKPRVPTPTNDVLDPLNWSTIMKYNIIAIVCFFYFLLTYLTTAPVPSFSLLEKQFDASYNQVNWSFGISAFGLAFGPLVTSSLAETYGRRVVTIVSTSTAVLASGCTSIKGQSIGQYMAARFFQGFAAGPAANVGLSIINDISWEHERGFRIGLWAMSANIGSVLGGLRTCLASRLLVFFDSSQSADS